MVKSVIASTIAQSSATLPPILFAVFVVTPGIWLETVPTGNAEQTGVTMYLGRCLEVAQLVGSVAAMLSIVNTRYVTGCFLANIANNKISNLCKNCRATHLQLTVKQLTALKLALVDMRMAIMVMAMVKLIAILSLGSVAQPERLPLGHVVEMIIAVMGMITEMEALPRHGLQEVVAVIIMAVMANMAVDTVVPRALQVELLHGNDTMRYPRPLRVVKDMDMEVIRVADMVILPVDIPLNIAWGLLQGLVAVQAGLVHLLD